LPKVGKVGLLPSVLVVEVDLAVVEHVADDVGDVGVGHSGGDVLAVAASACGTVAMSLVDGLDFQTTKS
jgi:hypothetical protein